MKKMFFAFASIFLSLNYTFAGTWTTLDKPGAHSTEITGISGNNIVGIFATSGSDWKGFLYDGTNWTNLSVPGASLTWVYGISGNNIVGSYQDASGIHGFLYDGLNWTTINAPEATETHIYDISGKNIVGYYHSTYGFNKGFLYDGTLWSYPTKPGGGTTYIYGIDGSNFVGEYDEPVTYNNRGFVYDGTWKNIDMPWVMGISGDNIVGYNWANGNNHGIFYDGVSYTTLDYPGAYSTQAYGVYGDKIFGHYSKSGTHGFIYTIPEPATVLLLSLGAVMLRRN